MMSRLFVISIVLSNVLVSCLGVRNVNHAENCKRGAEEVILTNSCELEGDSNSISQWVFEDCSKLPDGNFLTGYEDFKNSKTWPARLTIVSIDNKMVKYEYVGCVKDSNKVKKKINTYLRSSYLDFIGVE